MPRTPSSSSSEENTPPTRKQSDFMRRLSSPITKATVVCGRPVSALRNAAARRASSIIVPVKVAAPQVAPLKVPSVVVSGDGTSIPSNGDMTQTSALKLPNTFEMAGTTNTNRPQSAPFGFVSTLSRSTLIAPTSDDIAKYGIRPIVNTNNEGRAHVGLNANTHIATQNSRSGFDVNLTERSFTGRAIDAMPRYPRCATASMQRSVLPLGHTPKPTPSFVELSQSRPQSAMSMASDTSFRNLHVSHSRDLRLSCSQVGGGLEAADACSHSLMNHRKKTNEWFGINRRPASALRQGRQLWEQVSGPPTAVLYHSKLIDQPQVSIQAMQSGKKLLTHSSRPPTPQKSSTINIRTSIGHATSGISASALARLNQKVALDTDGHYYSHSATTTDKLAAVDTIAVNALDGWVPARSLGEEVANAVTNMWSGKRRQPLVHPQTATTSDLPSDPKKATRTPARHHHSRSRFDDTPTTDASSISTIGDIARLSSYAAAEKVGGSPSRSHTIDPYQYEDTSGSEEGEAEEGETGDQLYGGGSNTRCNPLSFNKFAKAGYSSGRHSASEHIAAAYAGVGAAISSDPVVNASLHRSVIGGPVGLPVYRTSRFSKHASVTWDMVMESPLEVTQRVLDERAKFESW